MNGFEQPWRRYDFAGHTIRLQILDPALAFDIEPELAQHFAPRVLSALASPEAVAAGIDARAAEADNPAAERLRLAGQLPGRMLVGLPKDGRWLAQTFELLVLERLRVDGQLIETRAELAAVKLTVWQRWRLLGLQLAQTFEPLWARSPYQPSKRKVEDYGVTAPNSPIAAQWAGHLSGQIATSPHEMLTRWTPLDLIIQVERAAMAAEITRRAQEAAEAQSRAG